MGRLSFTSTFSASSHLGKPLIVRADSMRTLQGSRATPCTSAAPPAASRKPGERSESESDQLNTRRTPFDSRPQLPRLPKQTSSSVVLMCLEFGSP